MADITLRGARKSYGKIEVVHGVDLAIAHGEFVVILGPSGCGKSTLLRMIAGLESISAGTVEIAGRVVNDLEPRERGCAMVFQNYALYPHMSVEQNIGYALKVAGVPRAERRKRVESVAAVVGLGDFLDRKPMQLSGGQRQRVAIARAMIREPKVFLFDEPLSNLDAKLRVQMRVEIRRLHARIGGTSVFVTHDQTEAMTLADRIVVMNAGRIEQVGTPAEVYRRPESRFVAGFIGTPPMNLLEGEIAGPGQVRLADGTVLPFDPARFSGRPGQAVTFGIRPENLRPAEAGIPMAVDVVEELGAGRLAHGVFAGREFVAALPEENEVRAGTSLSLHLDPGLVHLFEAGTGRRLPAAGATATEPARDLAPA
ncbi:ABC transporter ATP-binding protein [Roseomonas sp. CCTCC AB2023176]|uniref:ABC transporter ATP-binding protein n=1 Tax=Roseomonas sp. CCTCC AB2023176 TaxID=3342640 RepID=UPI0035D6FD69